VIQSYSKNEKNLPATIDVVTDDIAGDLKEEMFQGYKGEAIF
jgi:hypothetical protein